MASFAEPLTPTSRPPASVPRAGRYTQVAAIDWLPILQAIALIVAACACYWPALGGEFQWDDSVLVKDNELLRSLGGLRDIWASTKPYDYFPLTYTTFWLEWPLWGNDPVGYHLVNLALHVTGAFLLWRLLRVWRLPGAWFGALLFVIHPVNVGSVAWIAERKNTLSMVFYLACLLNYACYEEAEDTRSKWRRYAWAVVCFVLAALSKSSVVMLPFVLLVLAWWRRGKVTWNDLLRTVPFFAISLASGLATMWFQYHRAMTPGLHADFDPSLLGRLLMAARVAWFYLSKALLPIRLSVVYPRWHLGTSSFVDYAPALGLMVLFIAAWLGRHRLGRGPFAVLAYFVITLLPISGLMQMSFFMYSYVSDHLVHLSLVGIIVGVAAALGTLQARGGRSARFAVAAMTLLAGLYGVGTLYRADQFSTNHQLWESARQIAPNCFAVYNNLGADAQSQRRLAEAEADYRHAIRLEPRSFSACSNLATVLRLEGRWQQSATIYESILRAEPNAECYNNLAVDFLELGDTPKARAALIQALKIQPTMGSAYFNLYKIERAELHPGPAADALRGCLRCNPVDAVAMTCLASLSLEAVPEGVDGAKSDPLVLESAVALAERACALTQEKDPLCLEVLCKALQATGHRPEAAANGRKAVAAALALKQPKLASQLAALGATLGGKD